MDETQYTICRWAEQTFGPCSAQTAFKRCAEEFAELAGALGFLGMAEAIKGAIANESPVPVNHESARDEGADVYITLVRVAECVGSDLHFRVDDKMVINRARKWRVSADGVGQHVKEPAHHCTEAGGCKAWECDR